MGSDLLSGIMEARSAVLIMVEPFVPGVHAHLIVINPYLQIKNTTLPPNSETSLIGRSSSLRLYNGMNINFIRNLSDEILRENQQLKTEIITLKQKLSGTSFPIKTTKKK